MTKHSSWLLLLLCTAASLYGIAMIHTVGGNVLTQSAALLGGVIAAAILAQIPYRYAVRYWYLPTAAVLLLMGLTFTSLGYTVPGTDDRNWLYLPLGGAAVLLQPSELLKIVFILTFSVHLARVQARLHRLRTLLPVVVHGVLPAALVMAQGDDGNAAVLLLLCLALLFAAGVRWRYFLLGGLVAAAAVPVVWARLPADKQARFLCLWDIEAHRHTAGWQQELSVTAIGSGQLLGSDRHNGQGLYALHNDFIFTAVGEQGGFLGAVAALLLLAAILLLLYRCAQHSNDGAGYFLCIGLLALIGLQSMINIGMTLRVLPVLGITLPFFSAGGSSLFTLFCGVGLCLSVARHRVTA